MALPSNVDTADVRSPVVAKLIALLLLVMALTAGFAELWVRSMLVVPGDAAQTASRILAASHLYRLGFDGYLAAFVADVPVALLFYVLLKPFGNRVALVAASLRIVYAALAIVNLFVNYLGALAALMGRSVQDKAQQESLALLRLEAYEHGFKLALLLFGVHLLLLGVLLLKSGLLPKAVAMLVVLAGCAYLTDTVTLLASPSLHAITAPYLAVPASFEIVLAIWLLVKGVRSHP